MKTTIWFCSNLQEIERVKSTGKIVAATLAIGGTLGAMALLNKLTITQAGELNTVLTGEERRYPWKFGDIFYQVKGERNAPPLVLVHGMTPGASSYEWRKNVEVLAGQFRVYVLDLLGFGLSDRPAIEYTVEVYTDLIGDFLKEVVSQPAVVVAHGLSSAYIVTCAYRRPQLFAKVVLVASSPTLLQERSTNLVSRVVKVSLRVPVIGEFLFNVLTSRWAIRSYYERRGYHNPGLITDQLVEYIFSSAHQTNGHYPAAMLLSEEVVMDIHEPLARLRPPVAIIWGREDEFSPLEASEAYKLVNPGIETRILDHSSQQLQDEQAVKFNALVCELAGTTVAQ